MSDDPNEVLNILIIPEGSADGRRFSLTRRRVKLLMVLSSIVVALGVVMAATWFILLQRSIRLSAAEREIAELQGQVDAAQALGAQLEELEAQYEQIRLLFGPESSAPPDVWLPPPGGQRSPAPENEEASVEVPESWPLTVRGFVSRSFGEPDGGGGHSGLDVAVPTGSYVRTVAPGRVTEVGTDSIYGNYVRVDHGSGYASLYAHALAVLVEDGQSIRARQVIALSGSTGASTAPHLHLEILRDGELIDPLSLLDPP